MPHHRAKYATWVTGLATLALLAACTSQPATPALAPVLPPPDPKQPQHTRVLMAAEILPSVNGKTFQYTRPNSSGFVTYKADGTLVIQDDQRGGLNGRWSAAGDQYCETYDLNQPMKCGPFKYTGNAFFANGTQLIEMKI